MNSSQSILDLTRLDKVRYAGSKVIARCPACAEVGGDSKGNHLCIFQSGKYACVATLGDLDHSRRIFALAGVFSERGRAPQQEHLWREQRAIERCRANERKRLATIIRTKRNGIIARHLWEDEDVWEDSPQRIDSDAAAYDPRRFLSSLFPENAFVWAGEVFHSGTRHAGHWRTVAAWQDAIPEEIGPMTAPAIWKPSIVSRTAENVLTSPFTVLDFDGFDNRKPDNSEQIEKHRRDSLAIIRWIREDLCWQLAAIVWTGSKSMHAWFHAPPPYILQSLKDQASALGIDAGLIGRPEHPCRLPGQLHEKSGGTSRVLWLQVPG